MKPETGRLLRRLGLMIEAIGLFWLILVRREVIAPANLKGTDPLLAAKLALLVGFALWIIGNAAIYWPRKAAKPAKPSEEV